MDVKNTHSVTKTEISVFGRQALDAERRRSPSLADKVLTAFRGKPQFFAACLHFFRTVQQEGQSITDFPAELRNKAKECDFVKNNDVYNAKTMHYKIGL